jgi:hypothetical protein
MDIDLTIPNRLGSRQQSILTPDLKNKVNKGHEKSKSITMER